ncbi:MAG: hypothetical protein KIT10_04275 [Flavobacteriales bacterium]|nr:hypothetical protein [Flavobacteriales bacterium]
MREASGASIVLTILILLLTLVATIGGITVDGLYRDNEFVWLAWWVNDRVTLYIGMPLLAGSFVATMRGIPSGRLLWLGMLWYLVYNYAFYLFGAAFNAHFLLYVALFILPTLALIAGLMELDISAIRASMPSRTTQRFVGGYMMTWGLMLGTIWATQAAAYLFDGTLPDLLAITGGETHLIAALDLSLVVPSFLLAGWWLWRGNPWGVVAGVIANVKGSVYCVVLAWGAHAGEQAGYPGGELLPLWSALVVLGVLAIVALLRPLRRPSHRRR